ncbi:MAG: hypothetical protein LUD47_01040 [Clostridia bacterium]|nr:hypothetical protein [Clostridia bacterium]
MDDTDIFICLKDKFGNAIHNKNLASFTRYNKETGEKSKCVLLRPLESYGEDDEENFVFKNRIVYRVDEV